MASDQTAVGSWLREWLLALDADVSGLALPPPQPIFMR